MHVIRYYPRKENLALKGLTTNCRIKLLIGMQGQNKTEIEINLICTPAPSRMNPNSSRERAHAPGEDIYDQSTRTFLYPALRGWTPNGPTSDLERAKVLQSEITIFTGRLTWKHSQMSSFTKNQLLTATGRPHCDKVPYTNHYRKHLTDSPTLLKDRSQYYPSNILSMKQNVLLCWGLYPQKFTFVT